MPWGCGGLGTAAVFIFLGIPTICIHPVLISFSILGVTGRFDATTNNGNQRTLCVCVPKVMEI
jgi:hypothetical protein